MRTNVKWSPIGTGVIPRMRRFFLENPAEELSIEDAAAKFGCSYSMAQCAAVRLKREGLLERISVIRITERSRQAARYAEQLSQPRKAA